jgi:hypothetical protein
LADTGQRGTSGVHEANWAPKDILDQESQGQAEDPFAAKASLSVGPEGAILRDVTKVQPLACHRLLVTFDDGRSGEVDVADLDSDVLYAHVVRAQAGPNDSSA